MEYRIKRYCPKCRKIHEGICGAEKQRYKRDSEADKFRNTQAWKRTARLILERDFHLCRTCLARGILVSRRLSVHHIFPLLERFDLRLCEWNLITLCRRCHELAERGIISRKALLELAKSSPDLEAIYPPMV